MGRQIVLDSDEDDGDDSPEIISPDTLAPPHRQAGPHRSGQDLEGASIELIKDSSESPKLIKEVIDISEPDLSIVEPTITKVRRARTTIDLVGVKPKELHRQPIVVTPDSPSFPRPFDLDGAGSENDSQKRRVELDSTDEDEVSLVPARKRQRSGYEVPKFGQPFSVEAADRASMPPPASQESIGSRHRSNSVSYAQSIEGAARFQPSPPRLRDNMSFTTSTSRATSVMGGRAGSVQMFPPLDALSFQQRLLDIDLDQQTEPESFPAAEHRGFAPAEVNTTQIEKRLSDASDSVVELEYKYHAENVQNVVQPADRQEEMELDSPAEDNEDTPRQSKKTDAFNESSKADKNVAIFEKPSTSSTLLRVEIPEDQQFEEDSTPDDSPIEIIAPRKKRGRPRKGTSSETQDVEMKGEGDTRHNTPSAVLKPAGKKRGRPRKQSTQDVQIVADSRSESEVSDPNYTKVQKSGKDMKDSSDESQGPAVKIGSSDQQKGSHADVVPESRQPSTDESDKEAQDSKRESHSPLSSGKVPLRVGLSKRAQIEPLLKIVRK